MHLQVSLLLNVLIQLDEIALLEIVVLVKHHAALNAVPNLSDIVLVLLESNQFP